MTQFFRIEKPMYDSDYHTVWVNGHAWTTYGFPGVDCSVCGDTRGGYGQIVPYWLPAELAGDRRLSQRWPIPEKEHMALRAEVAEILGEAYAAAAKEQAWPGVVDFPPISWRVPTRPLGDIFWPFYGPIISARLADALRSIGATGYQTIP